MSLHDHWAARGKSRRCIAAGNAEREGKIAGSKNRDWTKRHKRTAQIRARPHTGFASVINTELKVRTIVKHRSKRA
ncbi:hypothetical protein GCM10027267_24480 [Paramicrobacterium agarici]